MADVFENAALVVAASTTPNPGTSFLDKRPTPPFKSIPLRFQDSLGRFKARQRLTCGLHSVFDLKGKDLLDLRGWAFQEKELARQWLSYSASETQWKCRTVQTCECCTTALCLGPYALDPDDSPKTLFQKWQSIIQEHTTRSLTKSEDKLPALMGLAKRFQRLAGSTYLVGLWKENIISELAWRREWDTSVHPSPQYLAPSFSWASISGEISYQSARSVYRGVRTNHSRMVSSHITTTQKDLFAAVEDGWIDLHGPVIDATLSTTNTMDLKAYQLTVEGRQFPSEVYFGRSEGHSGCEFTLDCLLSSSAKEGNVRLESTKLRRMAHGTSPPTTFDSTPVRLLSLFSLVDPAKKVAYDVFLILSQTSLQDGTYQRLGMGTGKIYLPPGDRAWSDLSLPFSWVGEDAACHGARQTKTEIENIRII